VAANSVTYSYYFKNTASADLAVTAAVSLPELQASADGSEIWTLAANDPDNFVDLTITAAGAPVPTKAEVHAYALGIDRLAEIKADHLPLIPFGVQSTRRWARYRRTRPTGSPRSALFRRAIRRGPSRR
jgi:hypothetical protein